MRSKYNVDMTAAGREARTCDNICFASLHEKEVYQYTVKPNVLAGIWTNLEFQKRFELCVNRPDGVPVKVGTYVADFVATARFGEQIIIEAKGYETEVYKLKKKHFEAQYGIRITQL